MTIPSLRRGSTCKSLVVVSLILGIGPLAMTRVASFEWYTGEGRIRPEVTRRAIAGLWKLTPSQQKEREQAIFPMKEFTTYPKKLPKLVQPEDEPELLLMLKEDGSFQQYDGEDNELDEDGEDRLDQVDTAWSRFKEKRKLIETNELADLVKGVWDYRDGKLILAADRPDEKEQKLRQKQHQDVLVEGQVVATYETSLSDNPVLEQQPEAELPTNNETASIAEVTQASSSQESQAPPDTTGSSSSTTSGGAKTSWDAHLSVPDAMAQVGKFFYPKNHPSFFEQPIYNPTRRGSFQLRQILGALNAQNAPEEKELVEKFTRADFYNKTFLLTSHPIGYRPKGKLRWSIKYNDNVRDPLSKKAAEAAKDRPVNIRVMQVQFFKNDTFATTWGTGDNILRGKFDVMGQDKDQLWMQIMRFGFGRAVSGSVYSEGRTLTHEDAKTYWGTIKYEESKEKEVSNTEVGSSASDVNAIPVDDNTKDTSVEGRLEVKGSVMFGWGHEPLPVGRFIMRESDDTEFLLVDDDDEEEDDENEEQSATLSDGPPPDVGGDGVDWSGEGGFQ